MEELTRPSSEWTAAMVLISVAGSAGFLVLFDEMDEGSGKGAPPPMMAMELPGPTPYALTGKMKRSGRQTLCALR